MAKVNYESYLNEIKESFENSFKKTLEAEINSKNSFPAKEASSVYNNLTNNLTGECICPDCGQSVPFESSRYYFRMTLNCPGCRNIITDIKRGDGGEDYFSNIVFFRTPNFYAVAHIESKRVFKYDANGIPRITEFSHDVEACAALDQTLCVKFNFDRRDQAHIKTTAQLQNIFRYGQDILVQPGIQAIAGVAIDPQNIWPTLSKLNSACAPAKTKAAAAPSAAPVFRIPKIEPSEVTDVVISVEQEDYTNNIIEGQIWCTECGHIWEEKLKTEKLIINNYEETGYQCVCPNCGKTLYSPKYHSRYSAFITVEETPGYIDVVYLDASINATWETEVSPYHAFRVDKISGKSKRYIYHPFGNKGWKTTSREPHVYDAKIKLVSSGMSRMHLDKYLEENKTGTAMDKYILACLKNPVIADALASSETAQKAVVNYFVCDAGNINLEGKTVDEVLGTDSELAAWTDGSDKKAMIYNEISKCGIDTDVDFLDFVFDNNIGCAHISRLAVFGLTAADIKNYLTRVEKYQCLDCKTAAELWCIYLEACICSGASIAETWEKFPRYLHTEFDRAVYKARKKLSKEDEDEPVPVKDIISASYSRWNYSDPKGISIKAVTTSEFRVISQDMYIYYTNYGQRERDMDYFWSVVYDDGKPAGAIRISTDDNMLMCKLGEHSRAMKPKYNKHINAYINSLGSKTA